MTPRPDVAPTASRRRRGRDLEFPSRHRDAAEAATRIFRRGIAAPPTWIVRRGTAAPPRPRRGFSVEAGGSPTHQDRNSGTRNSLWARPRAGGVLSLARADRRRPSALFDRSTLARETLATFGADVATASGNIHPRTKNWVGRRLATAYRALTGAGELGAGPILTGCSVAGDALTLRFDADALGDDGVRAWHSPLSGDVPTAALEVRYGDEWRPAAIVAQDPFSSGNVDKSQATVNLDGDNATGARYAWADAPFCNTDISLSPCMPNGGPLMLAKARLPALPFWAEIGTDGACGYVSTAGSSTGE